MDQGDDTDGWAALAAQASLAAHQLIGWIYWDPEAIAGHAALGVPNGAGYYIASRAAPLAPAGNSAVVAAFYSINPLFIAFSLDVVRQHTTFDAAAANRNAAVGTGLRRYVPDLCEPLAAMEGALWAAADALDPAGRVLFAAHRDAPRPDNPLVSAWLAANCMREWRGDTHWALLVANELTGVQAGLLHDAWMGYPGEWIPRSRGADDAGIAAAMAGLEARGLTRDGRVNEAGVALREHIEQQTNALGATPWRLLGRPLTEHFSSIIEPSAARLMRRIDETAGPDWMPAARPSRRRPTEPT